MLPCGVTLSHCHTVTNQATEIGGRFTGDICTSASLPLLPVSHSQPWEPGIGLAASGLPLPLGWICQWTATTNEWARILTGLEFSLCWNFHWAGILTWLQLSLSRNSHLAGTLTWLKL